MLEELLEQGADVAEDGAESSADGDDEQRDSDLEDYEQVGREAELRDQRARWCEDLYQLITHRAKVLGEAYPFDLEEPSLSLRRRDASSQRLWYVYFLACSLLAYIPKKGRSALTSSFEVVSAAVLAGIVPDWAVVDVFGTARGLQQSQFKGRLYKRIKGLSKELGGKVIVSRSDFHPNDSADNGLDLVAWVPLPGGRQGVPAFFGQCACGTGWRGKQSEADYHARWKNYIALTAPPVTVTFIPYFFRKVGGHWYAASDVDSVLIDRMRAMLLATSGAVSMERLPLDEARKAWNFRASV